MTKTRHIGTRLGCFALVIGLLASGAVAGAKPTALRWKLKAGEVLRYESAQTTVSKIKDQGGQEVSTTLTLTMDLTWAVKDVDPQGMATVTQTIDRIRTTATMPYGKFAMDSKDGDAAGPAAPLFKLLVGAEFTFKMNPQGELSDIKLSDKLLASIRGDNDPAGGQGQFSEAGLKNMLTQMGMTLPVDPVDTGKTWSRKLAIPSGANGQTREVEQTYTLAPPESSGKPLDSIDMVTKFDPAAVDPNIPVTIKTQEATGRFLFDNTSGWIESSKVTERVDLSGQMQGKEFTQSNETTTVITLQRDKTS